MHIYVKYEGRKYFLDQKIMVIHKYIRRFDLMNFMVDDYNLIIKSNQQNI